MRACNTRAAVRRSWRFRRAFATRRRPRRFATTSSLVRRRRGQFSTHSEESFSREVLRFAYINSLRSRPQNHAPPTRSSKMLCGSRNSVSLPSRLLRLSVSGVCPSGKVASSGARHLACMARHAQGWSMLCHLSYVHNSSATGYAAVTTAMHRGDYIFVVNGRSPLRLAFPFAVKALRKPPPTFALPASWPAVVIRLAMSRPGALLMRFLRCSLI